MSRAERILEKYGRESITFDSVNGCIKAVIRVSKHCKAIMTFNEEESNLFIKLV